MSELRRAVASALGQTASPEVIVMDDACSDGTGEMLAHEFPEAQVHRSPTPLGYIAQRNRAALLTPAPFLFSLDDDAAFSSPRVVEQTLREFDHWRVGAVAIPFVNVNDCGQVHQRAPDGRGIYATYTYIGTAHALRRDVFLALGGYSEILVHQGEEEDYCTRLLGKGYITRCGTADPIHHFESPRRSWSRMDYYGSRNKILYSWQNVPFPFFPGHLAVTSAKTLWFNLTPSRLRQRLKGVFAGYRLGLNRGCCRRPVTPGVYLLSRQLKRRGAILLNEIEQVLPLPLL